MPEDGTSTTIATEPASRPAPDKRERRGRVHKNGQDAVTAGGTAPALDALGFWDQIASLTDTEWGFHVVYGYRLDPPIRNAGDHFIEKLSRRFDQGDVLASHGSGKYLYILKNTRTGKMIGKISFTVYHPDAPPKIRAGQLAAEADPSWREWLEEVEAKKATLATLPVAATERAQNNGTAVEHIVAENKRLLDEVLKEPSKEAAGAKSAPAIDVSVVTLLTETAKGRDQLAEKLAASAPTSGDGPMLQFVLDELRETRTQHADEMREMRKQHSDLMNQLLAQKTEQANPLGQLDMIANVFTKVSDLVGKGGGPRDWKETLVDTVGEVLPKAVELGQAYITQKAISDRMRSPTPPASRPTPTPGAAPASTAAPHAAAAAPTTTALETPNPAAPTTAAPANPPPIEMDVNERTQIVYVAMLAAQALNLAIKGDFFAEQICIKHGDQAYEDFVKSAAKETLLDKMKAIPEAWQLLAEHEARLPEFIEDFYAFAEEEDDPDDELAATPRPRLAKAQAKKLAVKGKKTK
jgi:hypothetical protein